MLRQLLVFFGIILCSTIGWAKKVYVGNLQGISVASGDLATIDELVRTSVASDVHHTLVETSTEADYSIGGRIVKLGEAYSITLIKNQGGREVFRATLKASVMSDMDVVVVRLVRSIDNEVPAEENITVKDVTVFEQQDQRRHRKVLNQVSFGLGPGFTQNLNVEGGSVLWNLGYNYELDFDWDMHLDLDWLSTQSRAENDAYYAAVNFGMNYYPSTQNYSPVLEGHVGYGGAVASVGCPPNVLLCSSNDRASGWLAGAGVGFRFFRTSETNFAVVARGSYMFGKTNFTNANPVVGSIMIIGYFH